MHARRRSRPGQQPSRPPCHQAAPAGDPKPQPATGAPAQAASTRAYFSRLLVPGGQAVLAVVVESEAGAW